MPSPKVLEPPHNLSTTAGSKAVFTCHFEASTDKRITQIWWEFNGKYLAGPGQKRFQDYAVTQHSNDTNYIAGTLEIYSVQAGNAGQYTCYLNYDERGLNVNPQGQFIQSERKSATLSVQPGIYIVHNTVKRFYSFSNRSQEVDNNCGIYWCSHSCYYYCYNHNGILLCYCLS